MPTSWLKAYQQYWLSDVTGPHFELSQQQIVERMKVFLASHQDVFLRTHSPGHFTGSALVFDSEYRSMALTHHKKLGIWLQFGGHADGERLLHLVAEREAVEESGLQQLAFSPFLGLTPIDLDIHEIPVWRAEPAHYHYDVCYLMTAPRQELQRSEESDLVSWFSWDELDTLDLDQALRRRISKVKALLAGAAKLQPH
jgi:8-oxo-dGTP pyrophosphatase MutT (NUDIX family)